MKIIEPKAELWKQEYDARGIWKHIARCARTCFIEGTEVLTNRGFIQFKDINNKEDKVLTFNANKNILEYNEPNAFSKEYNGNIIEVNHPYVKFAVTPEHRILTKEENQYSIIKAEDMLNKTYINIPISIDNATIQNFTDYSIEISKEIPVKGVKGGKEKSVYSISDSFIILLAAFISEGHTYHGEKYRTGSYCQITQKEGTELYNAVLKALDDLKIKYSIKEDIRKRHIKWIQFGKKVDVEIFEELCGRGSYNKHLPSWYTKLSIRQMNLLLEYLYLGDGSNNKNGNTHYDSVSELLLNQIQYLYVLLGKSSYIAHSDSRNLKFGQIHTHCKDYRKVYRSQIGIKHYQGNVYCTQTDNGIICVRYKGRICWIGNCYQSEPRNNGETDEEFVQRVIFRNKDYRSLDTRDKQLQLHLSVLEHGTVYLKVPNKHFYKIDMVTFDKNPYSRVSYNIEEEVYYVETNMRVLIERGLMQYFIKYHTEPTFEDRLTFSITTDIGTARELDRHKYFCVA